MQRLLAALVLVAASGCFGGTPGKLAETVTVTPPPPPAPTQTITQTVTQPPPTTQTVTAAPAVAFRVDEALDRLIVESTSSAADWNRLGLRRDAFEPRGTTLNVGTPPSSYVNEPATAGDGSNDLPAPGEPALELDDASRPIQVGDYLEFCGSVNTMSVTIRASDTAADQPLGTHTFSGIAAC